MFCHDVNNSFWNSSCVYFLYSLLVGEASLFLILLTSFLRSKKSCLKLSSSSCPCNWIPCLAKYYKDSITLIKNFPSFFLFLAAFTFVVSIVFLHVLTIVWNQSYSMTLGISKLIKRFNGLLPIRKALCCELRVLVLFSLTCCF